MMLHEAFLTVEKFWNDSHGCLDIPSQVSPGTTIRVFIDTSGPPRCSIGQYGPRGGWHPTAGFGGDERGLQRGIDLSYEALGHLHTVAPLWAEWMEARHR